MTIDFAKQHAYDESFDSLVKSTYTKTEAAKKRQMERILECVMNGFVLIILSVISMLLLHMKVQMELPDMRKRYQFMNRLGMNRRERICIEKKEISRFVTIPSVIAVIVIGGWQVQAQDMKVGEVMAAITYLTQVLHGVMMMSMMFQTLAKASASANRLREVLETDPVIKSGSVSLSDKTGGTVSFKNVSFSYPETKGRPVISDLTLDIKSGESVAILGATGSGKSSLVNLIPRFYDCTAGEVLVDGVNVKDCKLDELRKKVGIVLQKSELFSGTVEDNIKWGDKNATHEEVISAAQAAQADEFIQKIPAGYEGIIAEKGASLSGGQKQRLSISRAVLKKPEILILDDSTSALDLGTEAKLRAEIDRKMNGTTLIIIAQRIQSVKSCDRIAVLDHGKLCACDTHENLLKTCEEYQDIYASQVKTSGGEV